MTRILLAQADDFFSSQLKKELEQHGFEVISVTRTNQLLSEVETRKPDLIVSELRLDDGPTLGALRKIHESEGCDIVVLTAHDSIASACSCRELGIRGYWVKPVSCEILIASSFVSADPTIQIPNVPMSLHRAMWEYMNQVLESTGSVTRAAQALGIDRRSLRRMISKYSP